MLQKHRQLWKGILTVLVVILYPFLLYTNFGYQMWGHPLNLFLSGVYMLLLCAALFVFGKSRVFLVCISVYWGLVCLSALALLFHRGWFAWIMLLLFFNTARPFFGILMRMGKAGWLFFPLAYALFWGAHLLGRFYEKRKAPC